MIVISKPVDGKTPTVDLTVSVTKASPATPGDKAASATIALNSNVKVPQTFTPSKSYAVKPPPDTPAEELMQTYDIVHPSKNTLGKAQVPPIPKWKVYVRLEHSEKVIENDEIILYACICFEENGTRLKIIDIFEGEWIFPVMVTSSKDRDNTVDKPEYLLCYVKVAIKWE